MVWMSTTRNTGRQTTDLRRLFRQDYSALCIDLDILCDWEHVDESRSALGDKEIVGLQLRWASSPISRDSTKPRLLCGWG